MKKNKFLALMLALLVCISLVSCIRREGEASRGLEMTLSESGDYYIVTGMVGTDYNKSTADTADDAVFYWMLLDKDNSLRASVIVTAAEILAKKPAASIKASGVFTIHDVSNSERTFTYEVIDSATALGYLG
jgi:hypothetical protein